MKSPHDLFADIDSEKVSTWIRPIAKATLLAWLTAQTVAFAIAAIYPGPAGEDYFSRPMKAIMLVCIVGPVLETYAMRWMFWLLGKMTRNPTWINCISALIWGAVHWNTPSWGVHAVWAFYLLGHWYLSIAAKNPQTALYITMLVHICFNTFSYIAHLTLGI